MKKFFLTIFFLMSLTMFSQEVKHTVTEIDFNYYYYEKIDGSVKQTGYLRIENGEFIKIGKWRLIDSQGNVLTTGIFKNNELVSIIVGRNGVKQELSMDFIRSYRDDKKNSNMITSN